ncbi:MAG: peptidylprolyl isomerase [Bdellovibrionota bacterium]
MLKVFTCSGFLAAMLLATVSHAALDKETVADVNGKKITKEDFDRRYKENISFFNYTEPTKANVLDSIIKFEIAVQEAKRLGLDKDPQVKERMDAVLYQSLVDKQLSEKFKGAVDITEKEARDYCQRNPAIRLSHVYVGLKPTALKTEEASARQRIKEAQDALAKGEKFEKVVANYSEGYSASTGGDTGFVTKMQIDPAIYAEARKLSVGQVAKAPVRSQLGLHIVKLTAIQDCNSKTMNIPEWQRMVFDEKRVKILDNYLSSLRSKSKISVNDELIKE